jgi:[acyl-carrier-protein] S-malonyltransferase
MEPAVEPIAKALAACTIDPPQFPVAENVLGDLVADASELVDLARRQVVSPVDWVGCAQALQASGAQLFLEAGPGDVLTKLAKRVVPGADARAVGSPEAAAR